MPEVTVQGHGRWYPRRHASGRIQRAPGPAPGRAGCLARAPPGGQARRTASRRGRGLSGAGGCGQHERRDPAAAERYGGANGHPPIIVGGPLAFGCRAPPASVVTLFRDVRARPLVHKWGDVVEPAGSARPWMDQPGAVAAEMDGRGGATADAICGQIRCARPPVGSPIRSARVASSASRSRSSPPAGRPAPPARPRALVAARSRSARSGRARTRPRSGSRRCSPAR